MRMGLNWKKLPPHKVTSYGLIGLGFLIMLIALPFYFYMAIVGGLIAYAGYTMRGK